jgi:hypothetical protein
MSETKSARDLIVDHYKDLREETLPALNRLIKEYPDLAEDAGRAKKYLLEISRQMAACVKELEEARDAKDLPRLLRLRAKIDEMIVERERLRLIN